MGVGLIELLRMMIYLVFAVVLGSAVLSWVSPHAPLAPLLHSIAAPFLRPFRRVIPSIANVDLSPLVLLLVLQIVLMVLAGARNGFAPLLFGAERRASRSRGLSAAGVQPTFCSARSQSRTTPGSMPTASVSFSSQMSGAPKAPSCRRYTVTTRSTGCNSQYSRTPTRS